MAESNKLAIGEKYDVKAEDTSLAQAIFKKCNDTYYNNVSNAMNANTNQMLDQQYQAISQLQQLQHHHQESQLNNPSYKCEPIAPEVAGSEEQITSTTSLGQLVGQDQTTANSGMSASEAMFNSAYQYAASNYHQTSTHPAAYYYNQYNHYYYNNYWASHGYNPYIQNQCYNSLMPKQGNVSNQFLKKLSRNPVLTF